MGMYVCMHVCMCECMNRDTTTSTSNNDSTIIVQAGKKKRKISTPIDGDRRGTPQPPALPHAGVAAPLMPPQPPAPGVGPQAYPFGEILFQEVFAGCVQQLIRIPLHLIGRCVPGEPSTTGGNSLSTYGLDYNNLPLPNYSTQHNNGDGSSGSSSSGSSSSSGYHFSGGRNNHTAVCSLTHDDISIEKFPLFGMDLPSFYTEKVCGKHKSDITTVDGSSSSSSSSSSSLLQENTTSKGKKGNRSVFRYLASVCAVVIIIMAVTLGGGIIPSRGLNTGSKDNSTILIISSTTTENIYNNNQSFYGYGYEHAYNNDRTTHTTSSPALRNPRKCDGKGRGPNAARKQKGNNGHPPTRPRPRGHGRQGRGPGRKGRGGSRNG